MLYISKKSDDRSVAPPRGLPLGLASALSDAAKRRACRAAAVPGAPPPGSSGHASDLTRTSPGALAARATGGRVPGTIAAPSSQTTAAPGAAGVRGVVRGFAVCARPVSVASSRRLARGTIARRRRVAGRDARADSDRFHLTVVPGRAAWVRTGASGRSRASSGAPVSTSTGPCAA